MYYYKFKLHLNEFFLFIRKGKTPDKEVFRYLFKDELHKDMDSTKTNYCRLSQADSPSPLRKKMVALLSLVIFSFTSIGCFVQGPAEGQSSNNGNPTLQSSSVQKTIGLKEYTVQVGSFGNPKDAYWESGRLRGLRINNFIIRSEGKWFVCVGRYWSLKRAERMAEALRKQGIENPVVLFPSDRISKPIPQNDKTKPTVF